MQVRVIDGQIRHSFDIQAGEPYRQKIDEKNILQRIPLAANEVATGEVVACMVSLVWWVAHTSLYLAHCRHYPRLFPYLVGYTEGLTFEHCRSNARMRGRCASRIYNPTTPVRHGDDTTDGRPRMRNSLDRLSGESQGAETVRVSAGRHREQVPWRMGCRLGGGESPDQQMVAVPVHPNAYDQLILEARRFSDGLVLPMLSSVRTLVPALR